MTQYYTIENYRARSSIGYLVRRARSLMMSQLETAFAPHGITFMQWLVLMQLRDDLARTAAEISREMRHDSGALTRVVDQLAERGLIERSRCGVDRRVVTLLLTDAGRDLVDQLVPVVVDLLNAALRGFTHEEADTLVNLLMRLTLDLAAGPTGIEPVELEGSR